MLRGVEVFRLAYSAVGMPWVARLTSLPGIRALSEAIYPVIAKHRYRLPQRPIRWVFERAAAQCLTVCCAPCALRRRVSC